MIIPKIRDESHELCIIQSWSGTRSRESEGGRGTNQRPRISAGGRGGAEPESGSAGAGHCRPEQQVATVAAIESGSERETTKGFRERGVSLVFFF